MPVELGATDVCAECCMTVRVLGSSDQPTRLIGQMAACRLTNEKHYTYLMVGVQCADALLCSGI